MRGLDDHITGHYGEDQFPSVDEPEFSEEEYALLRASIYRMSQEIAAIDSFSATPTRNIYNKINKYLESLGW